MTYINQYIEFLDKAGLKHSGIIKRDSGSETVRFNYSTDLLSNPVEVVVTLDDNSVAQNVFGLPHIPEDRIVKAVLLCNELNSEYRFLKFYIDGDNDFAIEYDSFLDENSAGDEVFAVTKMMLNEIDSIYSQIMKTLWG